jgi:hypothetical protein
MSLYYKSYNILKTNLGINDAFSEFNEISIRDFLKNASLSGDFEKFIDLKSKEHKIKVNSIKSEQDFSIFIQRTYITMVYQVSEIFMHNFQQENESFFQLKWDTQTSKESKLQYLLRNIRKNSKYKADKIKTHNIDLFEYYRKIRNLTVHGINKGKDEQDKNFNKIKHHYSNVFKEYGQLAAPNEFYNIKFDDFILYSRITKQLALEICESVAPDLKIIASNYDIKPHKKLLNNRKRFRTAIFSDLFNNYKLSIDDAEKVVTEIIEKTEIKKVLEKDKQKVKPVIVDEG